MEITSPSWSMERGGVRFELYILNARLITYGKLVFFPVIDNSVQHAPDSDLNHVLAPFKGIIRHVETYLSTESTSQC